MCQNIVLPSEEGSVLIVVVVGICDFTHSIKRWDKDSTRKKGFGVNKVSDAGHILYPCGHNQVLELVTAPSCACLAVQVHRGWMSPQEVFSYPFSDANEADARLFQNADLHLLWLPSDFA